MSLAELKSKELESKDAPELTDTTALQISRFNKLHAWFYLISKMLWSATLYGAFLALLVIEIKVGGKLISGELPEDVPGVIGYSTAWLGFVAQVISVVIVSVKHYFPDGSKKD